MSSCALVFSDGCVALVTAAWSSWSCLVSRGRHGLWLRLYYRAPWFPAIVTGVHPQFQRLLSLVPIISSHFIGIHKTSTFCQNMHKVLLKYNAHLYASINSYIFCTTIHCKYSVRYTLTHHSMHSMLEHIYMYTLMYILTYYTMHILYVHTTLAMFYSHCYYCSIIH